MLGRYLEPEIQFNSVYFVGPKITNYIFASEGFTIFTHTIKDNGEILYSGVGCQGNAVYRNHVTGDGDKFKLDTSTGALLLLFMLSVFVSVCVCVCVCV